MALLGPRDIARHCGAIDALEGVVRKLGPMAGVAAGWSGGRAPASPWEATAPRGGAAAAA
jgi:hypothetical protein